MNMVMQKKIESGNSPILKVSLHGMDEKMKKMMVSYFKFACKGMATVVDDNEAQVEIVDIDNRHFENILRLRLSQRPKKPVIALSLYEVSSKKVTFVKKPFNVDDMSAALHAVNTILESNLTTKDIIDQVAVEESNIEETLQLSPSDLEDIKAFKEQFVQTERSENKAIKKITFPYSTQADKKFVPKQIGDQNKGQVFYGKSKNILVKKNLRKTIRYTFKSFSCKLKSHSFFGLRNSLLAVNILNISSNSALIQSKEPLKLKGKATIDIRFDLRHTFSVPIRISRKNNNNTYGVVFLKRQHNLCDYLIDSGRPFIIDGLY